MAERFPKKIEYSEKYIDAKYEYRHVLLPEDVAKQIPKDYTKLLTETEWRSLGVQQSYGWEHYTWHRPEKHILMFRRLHGTDPQTGLVNDEVAQQTKETFERDVISLTRAD